MSGHFKMVWDRAVAAGKAAGSTIQPVPMVVQGGGQRWVVPDGMCGFAWVSFPGNTAFGRWAKKVMGAGKHYPSGLAHWVSDFNQSIARKEAYAHAFAKVLQDAGIDCHAGSRLD